MVTHFYNILLLLLFALLLISSGGYGLQLYEQDLSRCGTTKGCAFFPPKCEATTTVTGGGSNNCTGAFIFETFSYGIYFTLLGITADIGAGSNFVGVGFSLDQFMGDDTVIACVIIGGVGKVYAAWNDKTRGYLQRDATTKILSNTSTLFNNGDMRCSGLWSFKPTSALKEPSHIYDLSNPAYNFHFLFVRGFADPYSGELAGHDTTDSTAFPWISSVPVQFCQSATTCNGSSMSNQLITLSQSHQSGIPRLTKHFIAILHAIFMMTAWFCIAGPSILIVRYMKCEKTSCWFQLHRVLMVFVFVLVTAAFFGILYQAEWKIFTCSFLCDHEAFSKQIHTIAGFCVYVLLCFQVLCGIFRPGKTSSIRPFFNWIHTCSGFAAWISAATCCVLGIELGKTGFHYGPFYKWPEIIMLTIIVSFIICAIICEISSRRNKYIPEVDDKVRNMEPSKGGFNCCTLLFVLIYICISIAGVVILSLMLVYIFIQRGFKF